MNKKIFILFTLTLSILLPTCSFAFSDIEGHWAEAVIQKASEEGMVNGYSDDTFHPDENMTRAELVTLLDRLLGLQTQSDKYVPDLTSKDWHYAYMRKAIYFGIVQGDKKGRVNPDMFVSREEAVVMIARALQIQVGEIVFSDSFADSHAISSWAKNECIWFAKRQYIRGYEDNTFRPQDTITRAEVVTILSRAMNLISTTYNEKLTGNFVIKDKNVVLNNVEIFGDLVIGENSASSIKLSNLIVHGNLVLYAPILEENIYAVDRMIITAYDSGQKSDTYYIDEMYGISFAIPNGMKVETEMPQDNHYYKEKNVLVVQIISGDALYYQSVSELSKQVSHNLPYDSIFTKSGTGEIQKYPYELYVDNSNTHLLILKRDNVAYIFWFLNVADQNMVDSVLSNINLTEGAMVRNHESVIYKNAKLALKFSYKNGYVGVDDSYNTGVVYSGDAIFKLFIQVNTITDIDDYSVEEMKMLLKMLIVNDGNVVSEKVGKLNHYDTIRFEIVSEGDTIISYYVIIGQNLYNFIFKGETEKVSAIGNEMFETIIHSMEF